ncbi:MAG: hypothetical protein S0880_18180 [Actinomycetota bacterium]|nr:hypothetical protein [Actinomycetota bacterium]
MAGELSQPQQLLLWNLLITGETPLQSKLPNTVSTTERDRLVKDGYLAKEPGGHQGRGRILVPTDKAWAWAEAHCEADINPRAQNTRNALVALIGIVGRHVAGGRTLAEMLRPDVEDDGSDPVEPPQPTSDEAADPVRNAYLELSGGRYEHEVRLADLRMRLPSLGREELDRTLLDLQREERAALMAIDDPLRRQPADDKAALTIGGDPRHLVFLRG